MYKTLVSLLLTLGAVLPAGAADDVIPQSEDLDALTLADKAPAAVPKVAREWNAFLEAAVGQGRLRGGEGRVGMTRGALDVRADWALTPTLRAVFSDRLDLVDSDGVPPGENINTLREAYLSFSLGHDLLLDFGRANIRNGAAVGFNPSDWFKTNALRSIVNPDPAVLRENRQGTVVAQVQRLWNAASLTAAYSPRLARSSDSATFALNAGATNPANRWLLAGSFKLGEQFNPQLLMHGGDDTPAQIGVNLSTLIGDAAVAFGEFSAGKGVSLVSQALAVAASETHQQRASLGLTYTTSFNLSLTLEAEYNSAAPTAGQWHALSGAAQQQLLSTAESLQDLPSRSQLFFYASWKNLLARQLDLSGFLRRDLETQGSAWWLEARYHWDRAELALQWQVYGGSAGTLFYVVPQQRTGQLVLRFYI